MTDEFEEGAAARLLRMLRLASLIITVVTLFGLALPTIVASASLYRSLVQQVMLGNATSPAYPEPSWSCFAVPGPGGAAFFAWAWWFVAFLEFYGTALDTWTWHRRCPGWACRPGTRRSDTACGYVAFDWLVAVVIGALVRRRVSQTGTGVEVDEAQADTTHRGDPQWAAQHDELAAEPLDDRPHVVAAA